MSKLMNLNSREDLIRISSDLYDYVLKEFTQYLNSRSTTRVLCESFGALTAIYM